MSYSAVHISNNRERSRFAVYQWDDVGLHINFIIWRRSATATYCRQDRRRKFNLYPRRGNKYLIGTGEGRAIDCRLMSQSNWKMTIAQRIYGSSRRPGYWIPYNVCILYANMYRTDTLCLSGEARIFIGREIDRYIDRATFTRKCEITSRLLLTRYMNGQTDRQTYRHADRSTSPTYGCKVIKPVHRGSGDGGCIRCDLSQKLRDQKRCCSVAKTHNNWNTENWTGQRLKVTHPSMWPPAPPRTLIPSPRPRHSSPFWAELDGGTF